jgi:SAM-dependent methyltransferase
MRIEHLKYLVCPKCKGELQLQDGCQQAGGAVATGILGCVQCRQAFKIVDSIPRFVPRANYASSFGLEWTLHARTQYDSYSGARVSATRFFNETKWPPHLAGEVILEVGSGSGRFTEQAASTGAIVASLDYSEAVAANYASNGHRPNVLIVQGDLYALPFRENSFDKLFCFGVLQHTPDVAKSFFILPRYLKPGGRIAVDVYRRKNTLRGFLGRLVSTKYWVRPFTKRMEPRRLYSCCKSYVEFMWPATRLINHIPKLGCWLNWRLLIADYRGIYDLPDSMLKEWAVLDTFDMLSPAYDQPQTLETVQRWFREAGLVETEIHYGYNGIEGRGVRPA